jgi:hypothetical protein
MIFFDFGADGTIGDWLATKGGVMGSLSDGRLELAGNAGVAFVGTVSLEDVAVDRTVRLHEWSARPPVGTEEQDFARRDPLLVHRVALLREKADPSHPIRQIELLGEIIEQSFHVTPARLSRIAHDDGVALFREVHFTLEVDPVA